MAAGMITLGGGGGVDAKPDSNTNITIGFGLSAKGEMIGAALVNLNWTRKPEIWD